MKLRSGQCLCGINAVIPAQGNPDRGLGVSCQDGPRFHGGNDQSRSGLTSGTLAESALAQLLQLLFAPRRLRVDSQQLLPSGKRAGPVLARFGDLRQVAEGKEVAWLALQRLLDVADRFSHLALLEARERTLVVGLGHLRVERDGGVK